MSAENRLFGTEMEYGIQVRELSRKKGPSDRQAHDNEIAWLLREHLPDDIANVGQFLSNGARLYKDIGQAAEYSTPEDTTVLGTVANEIAGERILGSMLRAAQEDGRLAKIEANKRVVPYFGQADISWGYHENYLVSRRHTTISKASLGWLGMHLATRSVFCGAGHIMARSHSIFAQPGFAVAQKAPLLTLAFDRSTTNNHKPLVNLRDESHANENVYARVHVTSGDAHMSPWAARMQLGTTALVLALNRFTGVTIPRLGPLKASLLDMNKQTALDTTLQKPLDTEDGSLLTPLDVQRELYQTVAKTIPASELTEEEQWTLAEWERVLDDLAEDPLLTQDRVEWVVKKRSLDRHPKDRNRAMRLDMHWDSLDPAKGIGLRLRDTIWKKWMPDDTLVTGRMTLPPESTRAALRGWAIRMSPDAMYGEPGQNQLKVDWRRVVVSDAGGEIRRSFDLDPFETANAELTDAVDNLLYKR